MFTVSLMMTGQVQPIVLRFEKSDRAQKAMDRAKAAVKGETPGPILFTDDFDQQIEMLGGNIAFALFQDIERGHKAEGQMQLIGARANAELQDMARRDPILALAMQRQNAANGLIRPQ